MTNDHPWGLSQSIDRAYCAWIYLGTVWSGNYDRNLGTMDRKQDPQKVQAAEARLAKINGEH